MRPSIWVEKWLNGIKLVKNHYFRRLKSIKFEGNLFTTVQSHFLLKSVLVSVCTSLFVQIPPQHNRAQIARTRVQMPSLPLSSNLILGSETNVYR